MRLALPSLVALLAFAPAAHAQSAVRRQLQLPTRSLFDAQGLGAGRLDFAVAAGFPYVEADVAVGLSGAVDLGFSVETLYGAATQLSVGPKLRLFGDDTFAMALRLRGQWTAFRVPAFDEPSGGARHVTGLRNWGIEPSLVFGHRGRSGSIYGVIRYQETSASEPDLTGPLAGAPPTWSANVGLYLGGELATASLIRLYGLLGADLHLRPGDFPVLPRAELGIAFPG